MLYCDSFKIFNKSSPLIYCFLILFCLGSSPVIGSANSLDLLCLNNPANKAYKAYKTFCEYNMLSVAEKENYGQYQTEYNTTLTQFLQEKKTRIALHKLFQVYFPAMGVRLTPLDNSEYFLKVWHSLFDYFIYYSQSPNIIELCQAYQKTQDYIQQLSSIPLQGESISGYEHYVDEIGFYENLLSIDKIWDQFLNLAQYQYQAVLTCYSHLFQLIKADKDIDPTQADHTLKALETLLNWVIDRLPTYLSIYRTNYKIILEACKNNQRIGIKPNLQNLGYYVYIKQPAQK